MAKKKQKAPESAPVDNKKKGSKTNKSAVIEATGKTGVQNDDKPKPQRGIAVGDNFGWTGKLPVTLLHEHCQKHKWIKPVIDMKKVDKGFVASILLQWENPKTKEVLKIMMKPGSDLYKPKETTNEARHYAATYVLFRINFAKNMKMILPKIFRDYWQDLDAARKELEKSDLKLHNEIFNADPFAVVLGKREIEEKKKFKREVKLENEQKAAKPVINLSVSTSQWPKKDNLGKLKSLLESDNQFHFSKKSWEEAPFYDIPSDFRVNIERAIKDIIEWDSLAEGNKDTSVIEEGLIRLGFRQSHAKEALEYTRKFQDAIEWLIFHVPEDDLPPAFIRSDKNSSVSLTISKDLQQEYLIKRLSNSGHDMDEILAYLKESNNNEIEASARLTQSINPTLNTFDRSEASRELSQETWVQEIEGLRYMIPNQVEYQEGSGDQVINILLNVQGLKEKGLLSVRVFKSEYYPAEFPGIHLIVNKNSFRVANYVKISIIRQLIDYVIEKGYLGDCLLDVIVTWLQENIAKIVEHPGKLLAATVKQKQASVAKTKSTSDYRKMKISKNFQINEEIAMAKYKKRLQDPKVVASEKRRSLLPAWSKKDLLISTIFANKVTIITGETGSGKSTQVVQFILDHLLEKKDFQSQIICTQPRRISTIGLAERISSERVSILGDDVGYIIRGERKITADTRITFVTTGVLLRMLQSMMQEESSRNTFFHNTGYIFVDEVHERSVDSDLLLMILKKIMKRFPKLKIILMSATVDISAYNSFFKTALAHVHIEGRTFPISDYYLREILDELDYSVLTREGSIKPNPDSHYFQQGNINYDLLAKLCLRINEKLEEKSDSGSILVFLPGVMEINTCMKFITQMFTEKSKQVCCYPLHSALSSSDQKRVFKNLPKSVRKIVVSTNIAETSITIPDCVAVIDTGRSKSLFYDEKMGASKLLEGWCSKAEINQRRGRAGRIKAGLCYHLYTEDTVSNMIPQPIPEIKRIRLENLFLSVKAMGIGNVEDILKGGIDVPDNDSIIAARSYLTKIGALEHEKITSLGKYLSLIPADLRCGKMLVLACVFGCLEFCLILAAVSVGNSIFINSFDKREQIKDIKVKFSKGNGDLFAMANAYSEYKKLSKDNKEARKFLEMNFLSYTAVKDIQSTVEQYLSILQDIGFVPFKYNKDEPEYSTLNRNENKTKVIQAIVTAAFYPNIVKAQYPDPKYIQSLSGTIEVDSEARLTKYWIKNESFFEKNDASSSEGSETSFPSNRAFLHPSSTLFDGNYGKAEIQREGLHDDNGEFNHQKARELHQNIEPVTALKQNNKPTFLSYSSASYSNKLYLRDITPTGTISVLLFGGGITYDMTSSFFSGKLIPGIVLDRWIPIRTWCKNGVLIKRLRLIFDRVIEEVLSTPLYKDNNTNASLSKESSDMLTIVEKLLMV